MEVIGRIRYNIRKSRGGKGSSAAIQQLIYRRWLLFHRYLLTKTGSINQSKDKRLQNVDNVSHASVFISKHLLLYTTDNTFADILPS